MTNRRQSIARILLDLGAVTISANKPYTWSSGMKSPLYCDNRLIISTVEQRRQVCAAFSDLLKRRDWQPTYIAGTATAGIPHAAWLAEALSLPMVYVRSQAKKHGKENLIEGYLPEGAHCVVVEDLISTGGSSIRAAANLRQSGAQVLGVAAIFQYGLASAEKGFAGAEIAFDSLTDLENLLETAVSMDLIQDSERQLVRRWRQDPEAWSRDCRADQ